MTQQTARSPVDTGPVASFLVEELKARNWSIDDLSAQSKLSPKVIQGILHIKPLEEDQAAGLGRAFGTSAEYWINLDRAFWSGLEQELDRLTREQP